MKSKFDPNEIIGKEFNNLKIIEYLRTEDGFKFGYSKKHFYKIKCFCGNNFEAQKSNVVNGHTKSCGCLRKRTFEKNPNWSGCGEINGKHWATIIAGAKKRKLDFNITIEYAWNLFLKQDKKCKLSGIEMIMKNKIREYNKRTASLDRIDNTKGYVEGNVQWIHKDINRMKGVLTVERFIELCKDVYKTKGMR